jgi:hypothetical protein
MRFLNSPTVDFNRSDFDEEEGEEEREKSPRSREIERMRQRLNGKIIYDDQALDDFITSLGSDNFVPPSYLDALMKKNAKEKKNKEEIEISPEIENNIGNEKNENNFEESRINPPEFIPYLATLQMLASNNPITSEFRVFLFSIIFEFLLY